MFSGMSALCCGDALANRKRKGTKKTSKAQSKHFLKRAIAICLSHCFVVVEFS